MRRSSHTSKNAHIIHIFHKTFFQKLFLSTISEWDKLDPDFCNSETLSIFRKNIIQFIITAPYSVNHCHNPQGILTWLEPLKRT